MSSEHFNCIVIGTGISAEPVIYHLSKTKLRVLIVDGSNIDIASKKSKNKFSFKYFDRISCLAKSPKHNLDGLNTIKSNKLCSVGSHWTLISDSFNYVFTYGIGGLSNFWAGGASKWTDSEIELASGLPVTLVKNAYQRLCERLSIKNIQEKCCVFPDSFWRDSEHSKISIKPTLLFHSAVDRASSNILPDYDQQYVWSSTSTISGYVNKSNNLTYSSEFVYKLSSQDSRWLVSLESVGNRIVSADNVFLCAGAINSAALLATACFSDYGNTNISFPLNHKNVALCPLLGPKSNLTIPNNAPQLPEATWRVDNNLNAFGYVFSSSFLLTSLLPRFFPKFMLRLLLPVLQRLYFVSCFANADNSSILEVSTLDMDAIRIKINKKCNSRSVRRSFVAKYLKLSQSLPMGFKFIVSFLRVAAVGSDVHYSGTVPYSNAFDVKNTRFTCDELGQVNGFPGLFVCDASRLACSSSKPNSFSIMAIIEASMPLVLDKIKR